MQEARIIRSGPLVQLFSLIWPGKRRWPSRRGLSTGRWLRWLKHFRNGQPE